MLKDVFDIKHYTTASRAGDGLGAGMGSGENEIYTIVKLTKVK